MLQLYDFVHAILYISANDKHNFSIHTLILHSYMDEERKPFLQIWFYHEFVLAEVPTV